MRGKSILIVENLVAEREELGELLESLGYRVFQASTSDEALRCFSDERPDLVIVEVLLPGMGGLSVAKLIKEQASEWVKVIVTSKISQGRSIRDSATTKYKADVFLQKPFELNALIRSIENMIGPAEKSSEPSGVEKKVERKRAPAGKSKPGGRIPKQDRGEAAEKAKSTPTREALGEKKPDRSEAVPLGGERPTSPDPVKKELAEVGPFSPPTLAGILLGLRRRRTDGSVLIEGDPGAKQIFFHQGTPVFVQSNIREESLGRLLMAEGVIGEEDYREIVQESAETGIKIGPLLLERNLVTSEELTGHLGRQTEVKIARLFAWSEGRYRLNKDLGYPEDASPFEAQMEAIILLGYRKYYPMELIEEDFKRHRAQHPGLLRNEYHDAAHALLDAEERQYIETLDGRMTFGDAVADAVIGMLAALRIAYAFRAMGHLRFGDEAVEIGVPAEGVPAAGEKGPEELPSHRRVNRLAAQLDHLSHFELLGLAVDAGAKEIEKAFRWKMKENGPEALPPSSPEEIHQRAAAIARRLEEARRVLGNPVDRRRYLRSLMRRKPDPEDREAIARRRKMGAELSFQRGLVSFEKGKYSLAAEAFGRAASADPHVPEYKARAGYSLFRMLGDRKTIMEEALKLLSEAVKTESDNPDYRMWLAEAYRVEGREEIAYRQYQLILEKHPTHEEARRQAHYITQSIEKKKKRAGGKKSFFGRLK